MSTIDQHYQNLGDAVTAALRVADIRVWRKVVDPIIEDAELAIWIDGIGHYQDLVLLWHHTTGWSWHGHADSAHPDTTEIFEDLPIEATAEQVVEAVADLLRELIEVAQ
jgi:hypothetical protein